eukprot:gene21252-28168_t
MSALLRSPARDSRGSRIPVPPHVTAGHTSPSLHRTRSKIPTQFRDSTDASPIDQSHVEVEPEQALAKAPTPSTPGQFGPMRASSPGTKLASVSSRPFRAADSPSLLSSISSGKTSDPTALPSRPGSARKSASGLSHQERDTQTGVEDQNVSSIKPSESSSAHSILEVKPCQRHMSPGPAICWQMSSGADHPHSTQASKGASIQNQTKLRSSSATRIPTSPAVATRPACANTSLTTSSPAPKLMRSPSAGLAREGSCHVTPSATPVIHHTRASLLRRSASVDKMARSVSPGSALSGADPTSRASTHTTAGAGSRQQPMQRGGDRFSPSPARGPAQHSGIASPVASRQGGRLVGSCRAGSANASILAAIPEKPHIATKNLTSPAPNAKPSGRGSPSPNPAASLRRSYASSPAPSPSPVPQLKLGALAQAYTPSSTAKKTPAGKQSPSETHSRTAAIAASECKLSARAEQSPARAPAPKPRATMGAAGADLPGCTHTRVNPSPARTPPLVPKLNLPLQPGTASQVLTTPKMLSDATPVFTPHVSSPSPRKQSSAADKLDPMQPQPTKPSQSTSPRVPHLKTPTSKQSTPAPGSGHPGATSQLPHASSGHIPASRTTNEPFQPAASGKDSLASPKSLAVPPPPISTSVMAVTSSTPGLASPTLGLGSPIPSLASSTLGLASKTLGLAPPTLGLASPMLSLAVPPPPSLTSLMAVTSPTLGLPPQLAVAKSLHVPKVNSTPKQASPAPVPKLHLSPKQLGPASPLMPKLDLAPKQASPAPVPKMHLNPQQVPSTTPPVVPTLNLNPQLPTTTSAVVPTLNLNQQAPSTTPPVVPKLNLNPTQSHAPPAIVPKLQINSNIDNTGCSPGSNRQAAQGSAPVPEVAFNTTVQQSEGRPTPVPELAFNSSTRQSESGPMPVSKLNLSALVLQPDMLLAPAVNSSAKPSESGPIPVPKLAFNSSTQQSESGPTPVPKLNFSTLVPQPESQPAPASPAASSAQQTESAPTPVPKLDFSTLVPQPELQQAPASPAARSAQRIESGPTPVPKLNLSTLVPQPESQLAPASPAASSAQRTESGPTPVPKLNFSTLVPQPELQLAPSSPAVSSCCESESDMGSECDEDGGGMGVHAPEDEPEHFYFYSKVDPDVQLSEASQREQDLATELQHYQNIASAAQEELELLQQREVERLQQRELEILQRREMERQQQQREMERHQDKREQGRTDSVDGRERVDSVAGIGSRAIYSLRAGPPRKQVNYSSKAFGKPGLEYSPPSESRDVGRGVGKDQQEHRLWETECADAGLAPSVVDDVAIDELSRTLRHSSQDLANVLKSSMDAFTLMKLAQGGARVVEPRRTDDTLDRGYATQG